MARVTPEQIQHDFYTATAERYDEMHVAPEDEHECALSLISALVGGYGYESVLDVGTGTGRGIKHLRERHPSLEVRGVEPVAAMVEQAERGGVPAGAIVQADGNDLPFEDGTFDAVIELGVLHHAAEPNEIVREMTRVARRAVFLSDNNRFAGGGPLRRVVKWSLHKLGLWSLAYRLGTGGRPYHLNPEDGGVAYSYSVYDSLEILNEWADRVFLVPTTPTSSSWFHPLFSAHTVLLCALRDG
jgi:ubiquinone/menaquinone biosynthesis C-methylase UbiE